MVDLIASFLVRGLNVFFHVMPMRLNLWIGRSLGKIAYYLSGKRSRITYANLKAAFCREKTPRRIKRITKKVYSHAGQTFVEILSLTKVNKRYIDKYVKIHNLERLEKAAKNSNGMIFLSAHFGNWELMIAVSVMIGYPLYLLARDQKMEKLNELLNRLRELKGNIVVRKGLDIKNIFRLLRDGKSVGILGDQNAGAGGALLDLFGRQASTAVGPYRFAQKSGAWILPAFIHRTKGPYHEIAVEEAMSIGKKEDIVPYMRRYNSLLEKHVRAYPDQWFWMHKKWKMTPVKRILVLDDGKKGHLKQSLAAVKQLKRYRGREGFSPDQTQVDVVEIRFKTSLTRTIFNFLSLFFTCGRQGHLGCLEWALEKESYEDAVNRYADVIISCGSALFGVNKLLKTENNARNLAVLDPGALNRKKFNLVVIPRHDSPEKLFKKNNVIVTDLAPNLIQPEELAPFKEKIEKTAKLKKGVYIGLLMGGENPYFHFGEKLVRSVITGVKDACDSFNGYLYATTSRRTSDAAENIIKETFTDNPRCFKFISGKDDKDKYTVEKILAVSDIIMVSGESISMVSEAVSSGKPVLVFMPDKKTKRLTKYEKFAKNLQKMNYLKIVDPDRIPEETRRIVSEKVEHALPDDDNRMLEKMYKLF